jgi:hypothetical protein
LLGLLAIIAAQGLVVAIEPVSGAAEPSAPVVPGLADSPQPSADGVVPAPDTSPASLTVATRLEGQRRALGLTLGLSHVVAAGRLAGNDALADKTGYVGQQWAISPYLGFELADHWLRLSARFSLDVGYTAPDTPTGRRVSPRDTRLSLSDAELLQEPLTGINLGASLRAILPTSYESIRVRKQWGGLGVGLTASRALGPVDLSWSTGFTKYFNGSAVRTSYTSIVSDANQSLASSRGDGLYTLPAGFGNPSFAFSNALEVDLNLGDVVSIGYSVALINAFAYQVAAADAQTSVNADGDRQQTDQLSATLAITYRAGEHLRGILDLPFRLDVSAGLSTLTPALSADNRRIRWPVFYQAFGSQAAGDYGTFFLDLSGTY